MKAKIHPQWYPEAKVTCACGHAFTIGSTKPEIQVEICAACHPFFTGEMRFVDTQGRVEKFQAKQTEAQKRGWKKKTKEEIGEEKPQKTLKEMLQEKES